MVRDKIIDLLSQGLPQGVVAKACGVDDSYVSQLMADEDIRTQVITAKTKKVEDGVKVDNRIENIESLALERMENLLPYVTKPMDLARIFQVVNGAKKRTAELTGLNTNPTAPLVQINISMEAATQFKLSSDKQVVEVDGRSMATLPARMLSEKLAERKANAPLITDATNALQLLDRIEEGIPADSLAHVL
jgi:hypothetical protein